MNLPSEYIYMIARNSENQLQSKKKYLCVTERGHIKDTKYQQPSFECVLFCHCAAYSPSFEFYRMFCRHYLLCVCKERNCPNYIMHLYQQILTPYVVCEVFMLSATSVRPVTTISPRNCKLTQVPLKHLQIKHQERLQSSGV